MTRRKLIIVSLAALLICGGVVRGQQLITKESLIKPPLRQGAIQTPVWSPDGTKVAFRYDYKADSYIYIVNGNGANLRRVAPGGDVNINPVWSPDSRWLLFSSKNAGQFDLCKADREGKKTTCYKNPGDDLWPAWRPDGGAIIFCNYKKGAPYIYSMTPDGKDKELFYKEEAIYPAFSSDGKRLAISSKGDLFIIEIKNGKAKDITKPLIEGNMVDDTMPFWAPRGNRLAFIGQFEAFSAELYTISGDGKKVRRISDNLYEDFAPSWEPKGKSLVFTSYVSGRMPEIFVSQPESPEKIRLTKNKTLETNPRFSPDGKSILYLVWKGSRDKLYLMDADGKNPREFLKEKLPQLTSNQGQ